jgi:hypothetical protein
LHPQLGPFDHGRGSAQRPGSGPVPCRLCWQDKAFWDAATILKRRIDLMLALPLASLDRLAIRRQVRDIGTL